MESNPHRLRASTAQITIDAQMYRWMRRDAWLLRATACCRVQSVPQRAHVLAHPCHHAPICVFLQSMSKQMKSNPHRLRVSTVQITIDA